MADKKHGFFSTLKDEVVRGFSPARNHTHTRTRSASPARSMSSFLFRWKHSVPHAASGTANHMFIGRSSSLHPVMEGPDPDDGPDPPVRSGSSLGHWVRFGSTKRTDLRLLLGVMGAPLAPVHVITPDLLLHFSVKDTPIEASSAQYILQQYTAACGGMKVQSKIRSSYARGKLTMVASELESPTKKSRVGRTGGDSGGFVLWRMNSDMWYVELAVGGSKVRAGSDGKVVWRHTPWLGAHTAKGPVRPLRRALQGLDPMTTASIFADARCVGERKVDGEDCFILKLSADPETLRARSEGPAEIIRHVLFGYFSQKTGLLIHMEDSHLTRIESSTGEAVYWETTINSFLDDYRPVDDVMIAHSGRSVVTLYKFGDTAKSHTKTKMEEAWSIEEVAFNVPGLSVDCFIPPADLRRVNGEEEKCVVGVSSRRAKVAAVEKMWKMEV